MKILNLNLRFGPLMVSFLFITSLSAQIEYAIYDFADEFENSQQNARAVFPVDEGGYLVFGNTGNLFFSDTSKVFVLKADEDGIVDWSNTIGLDTKTNYFNHVVKTISDTYLAVGHHKEEVSFSATVHQLIAEFDDAGTANWLMFHEWDWDDELQGIIKENNGDGFVVIGTSQSYGAGSPNQYNIFMMKTDDGGNEVKKTVLDGGYDDFGCAVTQGIGGGYMFCGAYESGKSARDIFLIRTDENLDTLWTKLIDASGNDYPLSIETTSDGYYIVAGHSNSYSSSTDAFLLKMDDDGNLIWLNTYGGDQSDYAFDVIETQDNNYIICGRSKSWTDNSQVYIVKTDTSGIEIWSEVISYEDGSNTYSIYEESMNHYLLAGYYKNPSDDYKAMIVDLTDLSTSVENRLLTKQFYLFQCSPNPVRNETTIAYRLNEKSNVQLSLLNFLGIEIKTIVNEIQTIGEYNVKVQKGNMPPGIYFYKLSNGNYSQVKKMIVIE